MASAIPWAVSGLGGVLSGIGASKPKTSTSTYNNTSTQEANLTGRQSKVDKAFFKQLLAALNLGPQVSQSDRNVARGQINDTYDGATNNMEASLAARGYGDSGKVGTGFRDLSVERAKGFQNAEATLRDQSQNRFRQMIQAALQYMTPRSFTNTSSGTSTGTAPGMSPYSAFGSGASDLSSMLFLKQMGGLGAAAPWCWIAVELYGDDWRTLLVRSHLMKRSRSSSLWAVAVGVYALTGRYIARLIRWNRPMRRIFQAMFDQILNHALNA